MKKYSFKKFESRIQKHLPPVSTCDIDYLRRKYDYQLREIYEGSFSCPKNTKVDEYLHLMFRDLYYNDDRCNIRSILDFEYWIINYFREKVKNKTLTSKVNNCTIERALIGGRMYRTSKLDMFNKKYFKPCVKKFAEMGFSKPLKLTCRAFETAEDYHIGYAEDDDDFLMAIKHIFDAYCLLEGRPVMKVREWNVLVDSLGL